MAGIPPFIDMFYFESELVVWERRIIIFNKCLLSVLSIMVGIRSTNKYKVKASASKELLIFGKAGHA